MEIKLKLATLDDLMSHRDKMVDIMECSVRKNTHSCGGGISKYQKLISYFRQGKANVWLAYAGNNLSGYAQFFQTETGRMHLNEIAVAENCQGKGVGRELMKAVEKSSKDAGVDCIELFCCEKNRIAKEFYRKSHFETEKRLLVKMLQ